MQTLLNMFEEEERTLLGTNTANLKKLRSIHQERERGKKGKEFKYQMKTIFSMVKAMDPKNVRVQAGKRTRKIEELEFNPTVSPPDIIVTDKKARSYSIWYKPVIFVPSKSSAKKIIPEFVMMKGERKSMYDIDKELKKSLFTYEFLSGSKVKENSEKLLDRMHGVQTVFHVKREYKYKHLKRIKDSRHYLSPEHLVLISEKALPQEMKMNVPIDVNVQEEMDISTRKLENKVRHFLE